MNQQQQPKEQAVGQQSGPLDIDQVGVDDGEVQQEVEDDVLQSLDQSENKVPIDDQESRQISKTDDRGPAGDVIQSRHSLVVERRPSEESVDNAASKRRKSLVNEMVTDILKDDEELKENSIFSSHFEETTFGQPHSKGNKENGKSGFDAMLAIRKQRSLSERSRSMGGRDSDEFDEEEFYDCVDIDGDFHDIQLQAQMLRKHNQQALNVAFASKSSVMSGNSAKRFFRKDPFKDRARIGSAYPMTSNEDGQSHQSHFSSSNDQSAQISTNLKTKFLNQSQNSGDSQHNAGSTFGTNNNNSNYINNEFYDINNSQIPENPHGGANMPFQNQQVMVGFDKLPRRPNFMKFNEQAFFKLKESEFQNPMAQSSLSSSGGATYEPKSSNHHHRYSSVEPSHTTSGNLFGYSKPWNVNPVPQYPNQVQIQPQAPQAMGIGAATFKSPMDFQSDSQLQKQTNLDNLASDQPKEQNKKLAHQITENIKALRSMSSQDGSLKHESAQRLSQSSYTMRSQNSTKLESKVAVQNNPPQVIYQQNQPKFDKNQTNQMAMSREELLLYNQARLQRQIMAQFPLLKPAEYQIFAHPVQMNKQDSKLQQQEQQIKSNQQSLLKFVNSKSSNSGSLNSNYNNDHRSRSSPTGAQLPIHERLLNQIGQQLNMQGQSKASAAEGTGKQEEKVVPEEKQAKEDHEEAKEETVQIKMKQEAIKTPQGTNQEESKNSTPNKVEQDAEKDNVDQPTNSSKIDGNQESGDKNTNSQLDLAFDHANEEESFGFQSSNVGGDNVEDFLFIPNDRTFNRNSTVSVNSENVVVAEEKVQEVLYEQQNTKNEEAFRSMSLINKSKERDQIFGQRQKIMGHAHSLTGQSQRTSLTKARQFQNFKETGQFIRAQDPNEQFIANKQFSLDPTTAFQPNQSNAIDLRSNLSLEAQPPQFRVHNSNVNQIQRFSQFSDSVQKPQKSMSVVNSESNRVSDCSSKTFQSGDIDNFEQQIARDLQNLENIQQQHTQLQNRIGNKILDKIQVSLQSNPQWQHMNSEEQQMLFLQLYHQQLEANQHLQLSQEPDISRLQNHNQATPMPGFDNSQVDQGGSIFKQDYEDMSGFQQSRVAAQQYPIPHLQTKNQQMVYGQMGQGQYPGQAQDYDGQMMGPHQNFENVQLQRNQISNQPNINQYQLNAMQNINYNNQEATSPQLQQLQSPIQFVEQQLQPGYQGYGQSPGLLPVQQPPLMPNHLPPSQVNAANQNDPQAFNNSLMAHSQPFVPSTLGQSSALNRSVVSTGSNVPPMAQNVGPKNKGSTRNSGGFAPSNTGAMKIEQIHQLLAVQKQYEGFKKQQLSNEIINQLNQLTLDMTYGIELVCCKDQKCSRFIQDRLVNKSVETNEKRRFLDRILKEQPIHENVDSFFKQLVTDSFGNYVLQKVLTVAKIDPEYQDIIFNNIIGNVYKYATDKHGCRVMQIAFDTFAVEYNTQMVQEIVSQGLVKECSFDFHGNHVVQKIVINMGQMVNSSIFREVISEIEQHIVGYCINEYCCRIVQRMFEFCHPSSIESSAKQIIQNYNFLCKNEFGIFVLSSVLEHGADSFKQAVLERVSGQTAKMSLEKDGSKLIENCIKMIQHVNGKHQNQAFYLYSILDEILNLPASNYTYSQNQGVRGEITFSDLLTNKFSNYVIQKSYDMSDPQRKQMICGKIQQLLNYNNEALDTPLKHILKHLKKKGVDLKPNQFNQYMQQPVQQQANVYGQGMPMLSNQQVPPGMTPQMHQQQQFQQPGQLESMMFPNQFQTQSYNMGQQASKQPQDSSRSASNLTAQFNQIQLNQQAPQHDQQQQYYQK